jgi:D-sedoheptulose 7-phosphate isomerase
MNDRINSAFAQHLELLNRTSSLAPDIESLAREMIDVLEAGGKILLCGNGGSAADAQHIATELTGRFMENDRRPLPAIALTTDTSALTAMGNDFGFESIFARQVQALACAGDMVISITTSGNSPNVLKALETAKAMKCRTVAVTGGDGGRVREIADVCLVVPSSETPRIQEMHIVIGHILCDLIDRHFVGK